VEFRATRVARFLQLRLSDIHPTIKETNTMKVIFTGTLAAFVLGAAIASSQTPAGQGPSQGQQPSGTQRPTTETRNQTNKTQTATYRGYLRGSATEGFTISPIGNRTTGSTSRSAGASGTAVGTSGEMQTYSVMTGEGANVNLASMANQCVEIVGSLSPETGMSPGAHMGGGAHTPGVSSGASAGGLTPDAAGGQAPENPGQLATTPGANTPTGNAPGANTPAGNAPGANTSGHTMHRTLTVTRIRAVQGGCTQ
jgi:hypothetical protein